MNPQRCRILAFLLFLSVVGTAVFSCAAPNPARTTPTAQITKAPEEKAAINSTPVIPVFVALADNVNQGIVPVSATLGNGDNPQTNLYWGAAFRI